MSNYYVYKNGDTLLLSHHKREGWNGRVYTSLEDVDAAAKQSIKRIAADEMSTELLDSWSDGAFFRYITDYPHLERLELHCTDEDVETDRFKGSYTHKLPAIIVYDKNDSSYGNFHRDHVCDPFAQPYLDNRIRFYFSTCDIDFVYYNGKHTEVIPFPGNDQSVWTADFSQVVDRSRSLFGDYAENMFHNLGTLDDQLRYAMRVVKLYPNRPSFYKDLLVKNAHRASILSILSNDSVQLLFVLKLTHKITIGEIERLMANAQAIRATSCTALLLNYKNTHFTTEEMDEYENVLFFRDRDDTPQPESQLRQNYSFLELKDGSIGISGYIGDETNIVIPVSVGKKHVSTVCGEAFHSSVNLTRIVIPEGVTEIGTRAFSGCTSLSSIVLPKSIVTMGDNVFDGCTGLADSDGFIILGDVLYAYIGTETDIAVPSNVKKIYDNAFSGTRRNKNGEVSSVVLPEGLIKIGSNAFNGCVSLTKIVLPSSLSEIGEQAFANCTSLTELAIPSSLTELNPNVFKGCTNLKTISIPESVTKIRLGAFKECKSLTEISIPDGVTEIGDFAFKSCTNLKEINIPDGLLLKHCDSIFENCSSLKSITLPANCEKIGHSWFAGCSSLTSIVIPDGVNCIGYNSFSVCSSLKSVNLPKSVVQIVANAFKSCGSLTALTLPDGLSNISANVFSSCSSLKEITLPSTCLSIASGAFSSCYSLANITIPPTCIAIFDRAFTGCTKLKTAFIPATCLQIGQLAFGRCNELTIHTAVGAYAVQYAQENGIPYVTEI